MTQSVPPQFEGHIESPNPLELFWEKNKRIVTFGLIAAVAAIGLNYLIQYQARRATDERWSALAVATGLDAGYAQPGRLLSLVQGQEQNPQMLGFYLSSAQRELVDRLDDQIEKADSAKLEEIAAAGDDRSPLAVWVLARQAYDKDDFATARTRLQKLKSEYPEHFLVRASDYPVQWRDEEPKPEGEEPKVEAPKKPEPPKLLPAKPGSIVDSLLDQIARTEAFRSANTRFYEPQQPTSAETITFEFENAGVVKIKLFDQLAPQHAKRFLELARQEGGGWWAGQRVHEIRREPESNPFGDGGPNELVFGWVSSKEEDRAKWLAGDVAEDDLVEWEDSGVSHFAGTVAVEPAKDGKSQVERIVITGEDVAARSDGTRVVIGRVVEGLDVVREIINAGFADEAARQSGRGKPEETYTIKSVTVDG